MENFRRIKDELEEKGKLSSMSIIWANTRDNLLSLEDVCGFFPPLMVVFFGVIGLILRALSSGRARVHDRGMIVL